MESARIERYRVEDAEEGELSPSSPPRIRLPQRPPGTSDPVPEVSDTLLNHLKDQFPSAVPERSEGMTADQALIAVAEAWGVQRVIAYLERINKNNNEQGQ